MFVPIVSKTKYDAMMAQKDDEIAQMQAIAENDNAIIDAVLPDDVLAIMDQMRDDWVYPIAELAATASYESGINIPPAQAREIVRALRALGLARHLRCFSEDTTHVTGSGYVLTSQGVNVLRANAARKARAQQKEVG